MVVFDLEGCILGRVASRVAKEALEGKQVWLINVEKAVITGDPEMVINKYRQRFSIKNIAKPEHSPSRSRRPDLFVSKIISGMLPRSKRGKEAQKRIKVFMGHKDLKENPKKIFICPENKKNITVLNICRALGWTGDIE
ncbi:MAG: 50S ribosomal protein L13 [archaeon]